MQKIGVLRGGVGDEYYFSLESGAQVMQALRDAGYEVIDLLVDRQGVLHARGVPIALDTLVGMVDLVWNAMHGYWGEDGALQHELDTLGIPYVGSGMVASRIARHKFSAKERAQALGIKTPIALVVAPETTDSISEITGRVYRMMAPPWVIKPLYGGASAHTYLAKTQLELAEFVEESMTHGEPFIVEQYIYGHEAVAGVVDDFRGEAHYTLPIVEVASPRTGVLSHTARKEGTYVKDRDALRPEQKEAIGKYARQIHEMLGATDFSQSEFIVDDRGDIWYLETDTLPHFGERHPFLNGLARVGASIKDFVTHIVGKK